MFMSCLATLVATVAMQEPEPAVHGRLVDSEGRPLAGVSVAQSWVFPEPSDEAGTKPSVPKGSLSFETGADGKFGGPLDGRRLPTTLFAIDSRRGLGCSVGVEEPGEIGELVMEPLVTVRGALRFVTEGTQPGTVGVWFFPTNGQGFSIYSLLDDPRNRPPCSFLQPPQFRHNPSAQRDIDPHPTAQRSAKYNESAGLS